MNDPFDEVSGCTTLPGLYWSESWHTFFYRAKNCFLALSKRHPWHWIEYHAHTGVWHRAMVVPANVEKTNALHFLLRTGKVFKSDELETAMHAF